MTSIIRNIRTCRRAVQALTLLFCAPILQSAASAADAPFPAYKPSSRAPEAIYIRSNAYGAYRFAPDALGIGEQAPDFAVPRAGGGVVALDRARTRGPVVIVFYRGHW